MARYSSIGVFVFPLVCLFMQVTFVSCRQSIEPNSESELAGYAENTFYTCTTALDLENERLNYTAKSFNNTMDNISITATTSDVTRSMMRSLSVSLPLEQTLPLRRMESEPRDAWTDNSNYTLRLKLKADGSKSIQVVDHLVKRTASEKNGHCKIECKNFTTFQDGKCIATGVIKDSVVGNTAIEYAASLGAGPLVKLFNGFVRVTLSQSIRAGTLLGIDTFLPRSAQSGIQYEVLNKLAPQAKNAVIKEISNWYDEATEMIKVSSPEDKPILDSARDLAGFIEEFIDDYAGEHVAVLRNKAGQVEATVVSRVKNFRNMPCTEIVYLATAPKNLPIATNSATRKAGLGTTAIQEAVKKSSAKDCIFLYAVDSAQQFYKKLGFREGADDLFSMTGKQVEEFLNK